jgi:hypothetical protein
LRNSRISYRWGSIAWWWVRLAITARMARW